MLIFQGHVGPVLEQPLSPHSSFPRQAAHRQGTIFWREATFKDYFGIQVFPTLYV